MVHLVCGMLPPSRDFFLALLARWMARPRQVLHPRRRGPARHGLGGELPRAGQTHLPLAWRTWPRGVDVEHAGVLLWGGRGGWCLRNGCVACGPLLQRSTMLPTLPDELLVLVFTELDAAAFCRLSQVRSRQGNAAVEPSSHQRADVRLAVRPCMVGALRLCESSCAAQMGEHSWSPLRRLESIYICWWFFESCLRALLLHRGHCKWRRRLRCGVQRERHGAIVETFEARASICVC